MVKKGSLTVRHLVVTVLVVLLVNTQLTWWIIFVLRENRVRLGLERDAIQARCRMEVDRVAGDLAEAHRLLDAAVAGGYLPDSQPPAPFSTWRAEPSVENCGLPLLENGIAILSSPAPEVGQCVLAPTTKEWTKVLLQLPDDLELSAAPQAGEETRRPAILLAPPFEALAVSPTAEVWHSILEGYRGRILMMVSEGAFFALMLFVLVALLWRTLRREVTLEHQHRNFLSAVTHELKSPLASMRLSLETVLRGRSDPGASVRFLENALQDAERLQSLVEKVLEVTRYAREGSSLNLRESCLSEIVESAVDRFSRRTTATGANLISEVQGGIWSEIDEEAIAIVISNLLENALKYGGTIPRIDVSLTRNGASATLEVSDNGQGIAPDDIPRVYERFWRAGDEMTRTTQGTGLGLFLVQQIVKSHGGEVMVAQTGPDGTTFRVILPGVKNVEET
ncbi:MAG: HAMP domain-containing sensor histidine kinase [Acidobacteriota bacterium]